MLKRCNKIFKMHNREHSKIRILFVCLGNICRSPAAEAIFRQMAGRAGVGERFIIDSAGLNGYHDGERADSRMISHASERGYKLTSISRRVVPSRDFNDFDIIVGMDNFNYRELKKLATPFGAQEKIYKMTDFAVSSTADEVPDPYYGGAAGFENVLDILEDCSHGLLNSIEL